MSVTSDLCVLLLTSLLPGAVYYSIRLEGVSEAWQQYSLSVTPTHCSAPPTLPGLLLADTGDFVLLNSTSSSEEVLITVSRDQSRWHGGP